MTKKAREFILVQNAGDDWRYICGSCLEGRCDDADPYIVSCQCCEHEEATD